jgi:hypothetical protein
MKKKAYIVQGVGESTGCRLMTNILLRCGCVGKSSHVQEFQKYILNKNEFIKWIKEKKYNNLVIRFSFPHGQYLPDINDFYNRLKSFYDEVYIILTTRSWLCQEIGTIKGNHLINNSINKLPTLNDRMTFAYKKIFSDLFKIEKGNYNQFVVVNMGDLLNYPMEHLDYSFIRKDSDDKRIIEYTKRIYNE